MNDMEKAFAYQDEGLAEKREMANKNLLKLAELLEPVSDPELLYFVQEMTDSYMMNVCQLGRSGR